MAWFAAHELFTPLHHIRAQVEALLSGVHGPLPLSALAPLASIAAACRSLETALRALAEIERLRGRMRPRPPACALPLAPILARTGLAAENAPVVLTASPQNTSGALTQLLTDAALSTNIRLHCGRRWVAIELLGGRTHLGTGEGAIERELALWQLTADGARLRRSRQRLLLLWRRASVAVP